MASAGQTLNPIIGHLKAGRADDNKFLEANFGATKAKTKREIDRDRKVEALLEAYKKTDEEVMRKDHQRDETKRQNQKALLEKFGFSDEDDN